MVSFIFFLILPSVAIALSIFFIVFAVDSMIRGHDLPTSQRAIAELATIIKKYKKENGNFYDLGAGRGTLALRIKKILPDLKVHAIDNSQFRIAWCHFKSFMFRRPIRTIKQDIFITDISHADVVYTYLWYDHMPPLQKKFLSELPSNAIVITNTSHPPTWQPIETRILNPQKPEFEKLFIYRKGDEPVLL